MNDVPELVVYSRRGCHLCEVLLGELEPLLGRRARLVVRDVDQCDDWRQNYGTAVPVVVSGDTELCRFRLDRRAVLNWLEFAAA